MKTSRKLKPKGVVLPTLILVTLILMMLAGALLSGGTASLRVATHTQQSDQALYTAEAGLTRAADLYSHDGTLEQPFEGTLANGSHYRVTVFENTGSTEMDVPGGITIYEDQNGDTWLIINRDNDRHREFVIEFNGALGDFSSDLLL